jgi:hypothetical protein
MTTTGYHAAPSRDGKPAPKVTGDDPDLLQRTAHVRGPKERMGEFFSRVGLGAAQIRTMSKAEISHFVEVISKNDPGYVRAQDFAPRVFPKTFLLDI